MRALLDSTAIIDLYHTDLLEKILSTRDDFFFGRPLVREILEDKRRLFNCKDSGLIEFVKQDRRIRKKKIKLKENLRKKLSDCDCFNIVVSNPAEDKYDFLVTCDKNQREEASRFGVPLLWFGDLLKESFSFSEATKILSRAYPKGAPRFSKDLWPFTQKPHK